MYQVLVIDDDKLARKGLISLIPWEKYGMEVAGDVANGALALQFIETHPVDLAVVDLTASIMCMENHIPMAVFSLNEKDGIANAMQGKINGTIVTA